MKGVTHWLGERKNGLLLFTDDIRTAVTHRPKGKKITAEMVRAEFLGLIERSVAQGLISAKWVQR